MAIIIKNLEVAGIAMCGDDFESGKVRDFKTAGLNGDVIGRNNNEKTQGNNKLGLDGDEMIV